VLSDPVQQSALEADVVAEAFRLNPFVAEDFLPFGEELLIEAGMLYKIPRGFGRGERGISHGDHGEAWVKRDTRLS